MIENGTEGCTGNREEVKGSQIIADRLEVDTYQPVQQKYRNQ